MAVALKPGDVFSGRFRVERAIGRGGMGAVYEVVEESSGQRLALKVLAPQLVAEKSHRERFAREATITATISSPKVVRVIEAGVDAETDTPWLTMDLLLGESLAAFVRVHGKLDAKTAVTVLGQVAEALGAAHAAGVIHRDLKPDNVFVVRAPDGTLDVKVLDFGIAKFASETGMRTTGALGSPLWMAPEEAKKSVLTPAADVWAFGLLAFYVLTGRELWRSATGGGSIAQAMNEVLIEPLPNPMLRASAAGVSLPVAFEAWFSGAVVRDVELRFQSVADAWTILERVLTSPPTTPLMPLPPTAAPAPAPRKNERWPLFVAGGAFFVLGAVGLLATYGGDDPAAASSSGAPSTSQAPPAAVPVDTTPPATSVTAASPPPTPDAGPSKSKVDQALDDCFATGDYDCARGVLEPVVREKDASPAAVQMLYDLCDLKSDTACEERVAKAHPDVDRRSSRPLTVPVVRTVPRNQGNVADQARALMGEHPAAARSLLEPRVLTGKGTPEEASLLWNICKWQNDKECRDAIDHDYPVLVH